MAKKQVEAGEKAPDFSLPNQDGKKVKLSGFKGKWVVLYFYPKDDTPGCTIEGIDFTGQLKDFEQWNAVVLGVSPDSKESHCKFIEKHKLKVTLLSDVEKTVLKKYGVWQKKNFYGKEFMGVQRSTFLINPHGKIAFAWRNVNALGHAEEVRKKLLFGLRISGVY